MIHTELCVVISRNASVVDQKMKAVGLLALQILGQLDGPLLVTDVARQCVQATRSCVICLDSAFEYFLASTSDVNLGSVCNQGLSYHESYASATTGHNGSKVRDIEQRGSLQLLIGALSCLLSACGQWLGVTCLTYKSTLRLFG